MPGKLPLSRQEGRVLAELASGSLYKEIAIELNISINTVKKHLKNIYRKLDVRNRKHAAATLLQKLNVHTDSPLQPHEREDSSHLDQ